MALGSYKFSVGSENDGQTVKTFLRKEMGLTARSMTVLKYCGAGITLDGKAVRAHDVLRYGNELIVRLPKEDSEVQPVEGESDIIYEDDYFILVNKPADMPVHPTKIHQTDTLANILAFHQSNRGESYTFRALNRLDKDTSGCVLVAKDRIAYSMIQPTVKKTYLAVCEGEIDMEGTIDMPIGLMDDSKMRRCVRDDGQNAVTHYRPLCFDGKNTMIELWLETGRTHQIRCHMSAVGHPLLGDDMYGGGLGLIDRQALHCYKLRLKHPLNGEEMTFTAPLPDDMKMLGFDIDR